MPLHVEVGRNPGAGQQRRHGVGVRRQGEGQLAGVAARQQVRFAAPPHHRAGDLMREAKAAVGDQNIRVLKSTRLTVNP